MEDKVPTIGYSDGSITFQGIPLDPCLIGTHQKDAPKSYGVSLTMRGIHFIMTPPSILLQPGEGDFLPGRFELTNVSGFARWVRLVYSDGDIHERELTVKEPSWVFTVNSGYSFQPYITRDKID